MRHLLTLLILLCGILNTLHAQFTLTYADHYPSLNDQVYYTNFIGPGVLDVMQGGADQVWDFSVIEGGDQIFWDYTTPSSGEMAADYPDAEWLESGMGYSNGAYSVAEGYHFLGSEGVMSVGQYIEGYTQVNYSDARMFLPFPLDYGETVTDTWAGEFNNIGAGQIVNRSGTTQFEYDGYGTLILPHITLDSVVRVKAIADYEDLTGLGMNYSDTMLMWFSLEYNHYVAGYTYGGALGFPLTYTTLTYIRDINDIVPVPDVDFEASATVLCESDCVTFTNLTPDTIFADTSEVSWLWSFPGGNPSSSTAQNPPEVCYQSPGDYEVVLQVTVDSVSFEHNIPQMIRVEGGCGPVADFDYTPIVCLGQCYSFENTSQNATDFFWTFEGAANATSEEFSPAEICYLDETGTFNVTLTVSNENGSSTSITQQIQVVNPPVVNAGPDQTINQGTTTVLSAIAGNGTGQYIWQPFESVNCFSCPSTSTVPLDETTTFVVYYEQSGGCQSSDTLTVNVVESFGFGLPNSFSPNDDGVNDFLRVRGNNITKMKLVIYNRFGEEVFQTNDQRQGWDGTKNGRKLAAGVYAYFLEVYQSDGSVHSAKGDVSLVR